MYTATGKIDSTEDLVTKHLPLVRSIAHQAWSKAPGSLDLDDIYQTGVLGLMDAVSKYKEMPQAEFGTYAYQRIRGAIVDMLRDQEMMPRGIRKKMREVDTAIQKMRSDSDKIPMESEIAAMVGMSLAEYQSLLETHSVHQWVWVEDLKANDGDSGFLETYETGDGYVDPLKMIEDSRFKEALVSQISQLPEREKHVMGMFYEHDMSKTEIAAVLNVTVSRVWQIHSQAIARIRSALRSESWIEAV